eukprot:1086367-Rhodomonas_salina.1
MLCTVRYSNTTCSYQERSALEQAAVTWRKRFEEIADARKPVGKDGGEAEELMALEALRMVQEMNSNMQDLPSNPTGAPL